MKKNIAVLFTALFLSTSANAWPSIDGTWQLEGCYDESTPEFIEITLSLQEDAITIDSNGGRYFAIPTTFPLDEVFTQETIKQQYRETLVWMVSRRYYGFDLKLNGLYILDKYTARAGSSTFKFSLEGKSLKITEDTFWNNSPTDKRQSNCLYNRVSK